jgi:hypothetical protein
LTFLISTVYLLKKEVFFFFEFFEKTLEKAVLVAADSLRGPTQAQSSSPRLRKPK